jgi:hypothetical protein
MRLVILTFGHADTASTKYRVRQFAELWAATGIQLTWIEKSNFNFSHLDAIEQADLVINQKCLLPSRLAQRIRKTARRIIFDFDDAIWTRAQRPYSLVTKWRVQRRLQFWLREANLVTTANNVLADYATDYAPRVQVLPMAIDTQRWVPPVQAEHQPPRLGYAGSPASLPYLQAIGAKLCDLPAELSVMSGEKPYLPLPFTYVPYHAHQEIGFVQSLDLGLLPLHDDPFSRGKSPIKALQYLACGVPVVGNFIGAAAEFLDNQVGCHIPHASQWTPLLRRLLNDPAMRRELGAAGRQRVITYHDKTVLAQQWLKLFQSLTT